MEAVLDPDTQTVSLVSMAIDGQKARKFLKTQIGLVNVDGSKLDISQSASLFITNSYVDGYEKSLSLIKESTS